MGCFRIVWCHPVPWGNEKCKLTCITKKDSVKGIKGYEGNTYEAPFEIQGEASEASKEACFVEELNKIQQHSLNCQVADLHSQMVSLTFKFQALANSLSGLVALVPTYHQDIFHAGLIYPVIQLAIAGSLQCPTLPEHSSPYCFQLSSPWLQLQPPKTCTVPHLGCILLSHPF